MTAPYDLPPDEIPAGAEWLRVPLLVVRWIYRCLWITAYLAIAIKGLGLFDTPG
jgi:hypothetical protein